MKRLVEGIHQIPSDKPGSHCYVIEGEHRTVLVDSGLESNAERVRDALDGTPDLIVNTHAHFDHIGANHSFQDETTIAAHRFAAVKMEHGDDEVLQCRANRQNLGDYRVHLWLQNNTLFDAGGYHLKILHTPGHTSGCLCIYETRTRTLFSGDTVFADGAISLITSSGSYGDYVNSLRRLAALKIDRIAPGHGDVVSNSRDTEQTIRDSINNAQDKLNDMQSGSIARDPTLKGDDSTDVV